VEVSNTVWIARRLFTDFLLPFEVAAVILTVAVIAAVTLTLRRREGTKHQNPAEQARTRAGDRLRMVQMPSSVHVADDAPAPEAGPGGEEK
jgi:NADH-quinone oxidoreductase subunit J